MAALKILLVNLVICRLLKKREITFRAHIVIGISSKPAEPIVSLSLGWALGSVDENE